MMKNKFKNLPKFMRKRLLGLWDAQLEEMFRKVVEYYNLPGCEEHYGSDPERKFLGCLMELEMVLKEANAANILPERMGEVKLELEALKKVRRKRIMEEGKW